MMIQQNMSNPDHGIRGLIVIALVVLFFTGILPTTLAIIDVGVAAIILSTIFMGFCPIYKILGISTKPKATN